MAEPEKSQNPTDSDEAAAEEHVQQIMGPRQQGEPDAKTPPTTPTGAPALQSAPAVIGPSTSEPVASPPVSPTEPTEEADPEIDKAVDEITKKESDDVLRAQDQAAARAVVMKPHLGERLRNALADWWGNPRKRYGTLGGIVLLLAVLMAVPFTRYELLGLFLKRQISVAVVDSKTGTPVSGATVLAAGKGFKTEANGKAAAQVRLGKTTLDVTKKYYKSSSEHVTVTFSKQHNTFKVSLLALGRQVPVKVINKVTGKPLAGAVINVLGSQTKTDKNGTATVVSPSSASTQTASIQLAGYNTSQVTIKVGDNLLAQDTFSLTPAGKIYFLSNQSGKIDVVKANLDGTGRQTVLAGSGNEDPNSTSLLASRDWKYLALLAKRSGASASVYLIDTTNSDKLTTIDQGDANFNLVGWSGDTFVYTLNRNNVQSWQPKAQALKSFDATSGKTTLLDETTAEGTGSNDYGYNTFSSVYILDNELVYAKNWYGSFGSTHLSGKSANLISIRPDGTGHKSVKDFPVPDGSTYFYVGLSLYEPYGVYVQVPNGGTNTYYAYEDGNLSAKSNLTDASFNTQYATYLISPSSTYTFWTEQRDGKNTLFVGDKNAANQKQIATLSDYTPYGWLSDGYLLVSKNSSELYIMPKDGGTPVKITDYYKPPINYNGYGGGYGGL